MVVVGDNPIRMINYTEDKSFVGLEDGDLIEITFDGTVLYTYPEQVRVYDFEILEEGSREDVPQEAIAELEKIGWKFPQ